jgi:hypothetical protein
LRSEPAAVAVAPFTSKARRNRAALLLTDLEPETI